MIVRCTPSAITYRSKDSLQNKAKNCPKRTVFRLISVKAAFSTNFFAKSWQKADRPVLKSSLPVSQLFILRDMTGQREQFQTGQRIQNQIGNVSR